MKRIISLMLVGMIVLGLSGCFTKAPKLTVTQSDIVVEVNDETFTLDSLSDYIQASDYKNNVIPFADLTIMGDMI
ncbi:hypothetical protein SDC9_112318 [bioreactor metagenome]|uniref:Uncharacterized protein n=1 Tax=bioreactor metagenome TaxID=1076179 RepID=A0A645BJJ6_9ZZZZ